MAVIGITSTAITEGTTHAQDAAYSKWLEVEEGGVMYLTTPTIDPSDTDAEIVSPGIAGALVNGKKLVVGFNTTTAGANVTSDFHIDGSIDGKNWVMIGSSLDDDVTPDVTGVQLYTVDLSDYTLPWYRLVMNDGLDDQTSIKFNFLLAGMSDVEVIEGTTLTESFVKGIGRDPSRPKK